MRNFCKVTLIDYEFLNVGTLSHGWELGFGHHRRRNCYLGACWLLCEQVVASGDNTKSHPLGSEDSLPSELCHRLIIAPFPIERVYLWTISGILESQFDQDIRKLYSILRPSSYWAKHTLSKCLYLYTPPPLSRTDRDKQKTAWQIPNRRYGWKIHAENLSSHQANRISTLQSYPKCPFNAPKYCCSAESMNSSNSSNVPRDFSIEWRAFIGIWKAGWSL